MGIYKLMSLIQEKASDAIKKNEIESYSGRTVAVDASMAMYQFLISTQYSNSFDQIGELTDNEGNKTGHLIGLFYRSLTFLENGIKPIWVFDGQPPEMKMEEIQRRKENKQKATEQVEEKLEEGNIEEAMKQKQRTVRISEKEKEDAKRMLDLMGLTVIQAPCEAEAECANLNRHQKVYASISDDMDTLTLRTPILLRGFHNKKDPVVHIDYDEILRGFEMNYDEFVDLCILCGCDYTPTIDGIGPITAFKLIKQHQTIEKVIEYLQEENTKQSKKKKYNIPSAFINRYAAAREMFKNPLVSDPEKVEFKKGNPKPKEQELIDFLVNEKNFNQQRVESGIKKINSFKSKGAQSHLDMFFGKPTIKKSTPSKQQPKQKTKKGKK